MSDISREDEDLEILRQILLGQYQQRAQDLEGELNHVQAQIASLTLRIEDKQALIDTVTPILAQSIQQSIHDSKGEMAEALYPIMARSIQQSIENSKEQMVEALYPIVGRLVSRSVSEAMRDLARRIDEQMRNTFSTDSISRRIRAQVSGVSQAELAMRNALPFEVRRIFLIDRETGILLNYLNPAPTEERQDEDDDSDVIGGMLTAIRDFVQDAFGRGEEGELDAIHYGDRTILIETAKHTYIAVVATGITPAGYHGVMRQNLYQIEDRFGEVLRHFDGDVSELTGTLRYLTPLIIDSEATDRARESVKEQTSDQVRSALGVLLLTIFLIVLLVLFGWWAYRTAGG
ncbi:MAG: hypothetical protein KDD92_09635 [Caldilineaceae bacterium]|nr:hypothetical protein [Caldilineaceae bacterium]